MLADQTPSNSLEELNDEEQAALREGQRRLMAHQSLATSEGRSRLLRKQQKSTPKQTA
jgi:hypothetical protein